MPSETQTLLFVAAENDGPSLHEVLRASALILAHGVDVATMRPAVAANLVQIDGLDIRFRHPLVRSAIHQAADPAMRASIHRALADVTRDEPDRHVWHKAAASMAPDEGLAVEGPGDDDGEGASDGADEEEDDVLERMLGGARASKKPRVA